MTSSPPHHRFRCDTIASMAALAQARSEFARWLAEETAGEALEDLVVVVSELGANAVAGTPEDAPPASLEAWVTPEEVHIVVRNRVDDDAATDDWDLDDPLRTGGRGLVLVSAFVDAVDVEVDDHVLAVHCTARR